MVCIRTPFGNNSIYSWLLFEARNLLLDVRWTWIWKLKAPEKNQDVYLQLFYNSLPANLLRFKHHIFSFPICGGYNQEDEDILHCIKDCVFGKSIWLRLGLTNQQRF